MIDIGLFINDIFERGLEIDPEPRILKKQLPQILKNTLTEEEQEFLLDSSQPYYRDGKRYWKGKRVELNALMSDELIAYIEKKLEENGLTEKVLPPKYIVDAESEDEAKNSLKKEIAYSIEEILNIEEIISRIYHELENDVDLDDLYEFLKDNLKGNPPKLWKDILKDEVSEKAQKIVDEHDDTVMDFVKNAVLKNENLAT